MLSGITNTHTFMDLLSTGTSCIFSVTCLGHTVTPCISHVKVHNHIMANSSILRLQHERAYVGDCLKAGLRQDSTAIDSLPLGDLGPDRGSWQALEKQRCSSVSQLVSYQQMQLRDCELGAKKHVLNNSWYLTCLLRKISRSWLLTFWGFSCFLSLCSSSTPPLWIQICSFKDREFQWAPK